jgi:hypothetical protein
MMTREAQVDPGYRLEPSVIGVPSPQHSSISVCAGSGIVSPGARGLVGLSPLG